MTKILRRVGEGCPFILGYYEGTKGNHQTFLQYDEAVFGQVHYDNDNDNDKREQMVSLENVAKHIF